VNNVSSIITIAKITVTTSELVVAGAFYIKVSHVVYVAIIK